jgi:integrase/recombinase XerD
MQNLEAMKTLYIENMRERNLRESTIEKALQSVEKLCSFLLNQCGINDIREITKDNIRQYMEYLQAFKQKRRDSPLSPKHQYSLLKEAGRFFRYLETSDKILTSPMTDIEMNIPKKAFPKDILTEDEARALLDAPDVKSAAGIKHRAILEILYGSGIRNAELRGLNLSDLDLENGFLFVSGKGAKDRLVPITNMAMRYLKDYITGERSKNLSKYPLENHLFLMVNARPLKKWYLNIMLKKYAKEAGIEKNVTPHTIRHTCASHLLARGAGLRYVQELLGHAWICTTEIYTHVLPVNLQKVYEKTHPRCIGIKRGRPHSGKPKSGKAKI